MLKLAEGSEPVRLGPLPDLRPGDVPNFLYEDRSGALWIGTSDSGLFLCDGEQCIHVNTSHYRILCITEDREGSLWVGTAGGGLNRLRPRALELHTSKFRELAKPVDSACADLKGDLWSVTGGLLAQRHGGAWTLMSTNQPLRPPNVISYATCVAASPQGGVWVGSHYNGLYFWNEGSIRNVRKPQGLAGNFVCALWVSPSGDVWFGTDTPNTLQRLRGAEIRTFDLPPGNTPVTAMAMDGLGNLWAGTADGFLLRVKDDLLVDETRNTLSGPTAIHALCVTPDNSLWIGYAGAGLGRLKAGRFTQFRTEQGLHENHVVQMVPDGLGWLWLAGNQELFRVRLEDFDVLEAGRRPRVRSVVCGRETGLLSERQPTRGFWPRALRSTDGHLWFPMLSGLLEVKVDEVGRNPLPPPVVVEQVWVDGKKVAIPGADDLRKQSPNRSWLDSRPGEIPLRLPANNQRMEVQFTALSYTDPRNVAFKYMLEGLDKDWVDAGSERVAKFSHLAPGDYRFQVIACNNDGIWNETGASLALSVATPFWQTRWFIAVASLAALGCVAGIVRYVTVLRMRRQLERLEREHAIERERARIAKDMHDDLGASLSEITLLSELAQGAESSPWEVQSDLRKIATKARSVTRSLAEIVWAVNPQHDAFDDFVTYTCNFAEDYLRLAGIRCRLDLPAKLPNIALTTHVRHNLFLVVKEALHNTVKHAAASEVWLRIALNADGFRLLIEDNGRGFDLEATATGTRCQTQGHGLSNLRQRAEDIGGRLEMRSQPGQGSTVQLEVDFSRP